MTQYHQCDPSHVVESVFNQEETQPVDSSQKNASLSDSWASFRDSRAQVNHVAEKLRHGNEVWNQQKHTQEFFSEDPRLQTLLDEVIEEHRLVEEDTAVEEDVFLCSNVVLTSKADVDGTWSSVNVDGDDLHF